VIFKKLKRKDNISAYIFFLNMSIRTKTNKRLFVFVYILSFSIISSKQETAKKIAA